MSRILVLEDDDHLRTVLVKALEDEDYAVVGCSSGDEAIEQARQQDFALVIADVKMQGMDGLGAVSLIQSLQPDMSSIVVTGYANTIEMARAENLCLDGFLQKPFELDDLLDQVEVLLSKQSALTAEARLEFERIEWARWVNEREADRLKVSDELSRVARALSSRLGLGRFESEQLLSAQLWLASQDDTEARVPEAIRRFWGAESKGLERDASRALSTLIGHQADDCPPHLLALVEELKDQDSPNSASQKNLIDEAHVHFQNGDYGACERVLDEFFLSTAAYGRDRVRGQILRAEILLRSNRPDKATQSVKRMMESARQDGPLALSEASSAAGLFLLQRQLHTDAASCYNEAAKACKVLDLKSEAEVCELLRDLLATPRLTESFKPRISALAEPEFNVALSKHRVGLDLVFNRWNSTIEDAIAQAKGSKERSLKPRLELYSLGGFKAVFNGQEIPKSWWRSSKARQLVCYLALDHGRLSEESLVEQFWPGDPTKGKNNLYTTASCIRGALRKAGYEADPLERSGGTLALSSELEVWHDCRQLMNSSSSREVAESRRLLSLYKGTFLPDCYMDWAEETKRRVNESVLNISLELARSAVDNDRLTEAIECGRTALTISPCLDGAHIAVMEALLKQNRYLEVMRHYEACQQTYRLELEHSPPIEVERLYQQARLSL